MQLNVDFLCHGEQKTAKCKIKCELEDVGHRQSKISDTLNSKSMPLLNFLHTDLGSPSKSYFPE